MTIDWSKAPEGATHWCSENRLFYRTGEPHVSVHAGGRWIDAHIKHHQMYSLVNDSFIHRPSGPTPYTRDEALQFLVDELDNWPTDVKDPTTCPGWCWRITEDDDIISFEDGGEFGIFRLHWCERRRLMSNTLTPWPSEPKPYTRDEALQFLVERLDSWPTDIADAPLCPGWGWAAQPGQKGFVIFHNGSSGIVRTDWQSTRPDFVPFVSVEDAQPATAKQPTPSGKGDPILGMVLADLTNRALEGREKYGEALKANNGRNALWDAYQEALDLAMYLRQAIEEQHRAQTDR